MTAIFELAEDLVKKQAALDPIAATFDGIDGYEDKLTDYSPTGFMQRAELSREFLKRLDQMPSENQRDDITREVIIDRLQLHIESFEAGDYMEDLAFSWSPMQAIRSVFDHMNAASADDWHNVLARLESVPSALTSYRQTLEQSIATNKTSALRQVESCIAQARTWAGTSARTTSFAAALVDPAVQGGIARGKFADELHKAATQAAVAFDEFGEFLKHDYAPAAHTTDAVGHDRYVREANSYLGMHIDTNDVYEWGWHELDRLNVEIADVCKQINPSASLDEIVIQLNDDHEHWIHGEEQLVDWLHALLQNTILKLDGSVFNIPPPLVQLDVKIAPPGGPAYQYYVPPSEDLSRPGTYWYPTQGRTRFPMWAEVSTAYHEGVPGHHLQGGWIKLQHDDLSRFQRNLFISGHGEGWALYAERLADEVGLLDRPEYRLDMLLSHLFRAARVVVDIGMHLQLPIPAASSFHPGAIWTPELGHAFMLANSNLSDEFISSEILRYLGIPGQAISYKLGERVWLDSRAHAKQVKGTSFDLKQWHSDMLSMGAMGLDQLTRLAVTH